jgi:predicted nucleotidyltransferase component of viral defense system
MIQRNAIVEWRKKAPWKDPRFVEQDLVISRALVSIFQDKYLKEKLAFRGGTAIYKLFLTPPARYSEDIDFVQMDAEPIGQVLDRIRTALSFLGDPKIKQKANNNVLVYRFNAEEPQGAVLSLKIEINSREHIPVYEREIRLFKIESQWFSGECGIVTYSFNELMGTKLRALYQRKKGRDLFDLYAALESGKLDVRATVECYKKYMAFHDLHVPTRVEYARNLEDKMADSEFRRDILPFLVQGVEYDIDKAYKTVCEQIIELT